MNRFIIIAYVAGCLFGALIVWLIMRPGRHTTDQGRVFLGRHITKGMAAVAYAKAAIRYHGVYCQAVSKAAPLALSLNNSATRGPSDLPPR